MENIYLQELVSATRGQFLIGDPHFQITGISIDTRTLRRGDFYFAVPGKNFDGHDFLKAAIEKGAAGVVITRNDVDLGNPFPVFPAVVKVADTVRALGDFAGFYRRKWPIPLIAITGSNGKTTTKEMLSSILRHRGETLSTAGNFNNQVGLPLTLLKLGPAHRFAVIEMGTSFPGEIARLAEIASPNAGILTNIGHGHLENFKDQEGVFQEKRNLADRLPEDGFAVINMDDPFLRRLPGESARDWMTFGIEQKAQVRATDITVWPETPGFTLNIGDKHTLIHLPVHGRFNIYNALGAAAAAWRLGFDLETIKDGLEHFTPPAMRMETHTLISGAVVINDAYNANPSSMRASVLSLVQSFPEREKVVVLGDMLELGEHSASLHRELGEFLASQPLSRVYLYGPLMKNARDGYGASANYFEKKEDLAAALRNAIPAEGVLLFKGSRGMRLEEIVQRVLAEEGDSAAPAK